MSCFYCLNQSTRRSIVVDPRAIKHCKNIGKSSCTNCRLVVPIHKVDCKSPYTKKTWEPGWSVEGQTPTFMRDEDPVTFGGKKYLFGNVPALDVLRLGAHEGEACGNQLRLLFSASGDLRNVVQTITQLPPSYEQPIEIIMDDHEFDVVARNVIILLLALTADDQDEAADYILHIWYSSFIRKSHFDKLKQRMRPLIQSVCDKTWTFEKRSVRLVLEKEAWDKLLSFMDVPDGLTIDKANEVRKAVTLARSRFDHRDRYYLFLSPSHRVAKQRFRQDGLLLPFGARRSEHCEPNPTFFQSLDSWSMPDCVDPLCGWSLHEVDKTPIGLATSDIYGKPFYYVRSMLEKFMDRMSKSTIAFQLLQVHAATLPNHLDESFDRIDVSNISDSGYLGAHRTVALVALLLRAPPTNPHATLITWFMNLIDENFTLQDQITEWTLGSLSTKRLANYLLPTRPNRGIIDPALMKFAHARHHLREYDDIFGR
ncbi:hypothetical protein BKA60DRAFT_594076 [Fusarium oxysporum]|nr:hypothetical protein BKA60DRAFT_594076 [Fusarium oxysporum]